VRGNLIEQKPALTPAFQSSVMQNSYDFSPTTPSPTVKPNTG
jgi:hypothetical protein